MTENFENAEASFISMMMDRLQAMEQQINILRAENAVLASRLPPPLYLTSHSCYQDFNDGFSISWKILDEPMFYDQRADAYDEDGYFNEERFVPMDQEHWEAVVFPSGVMMKCELEFQKMFFIGEHGKPLTVRDLMQGVHTVLRTHSTTLHEHTGYYNGLTVHAGTCQSYVELDVLY